ncbi:MAG: pyridoxamine 5'-phosphate oxidase family protein [Polaromonas sp.]|uniref:pyridoxamine 5'-phosphate oxidase family protein n=1 Tax=Polaromonas sp. TaxID=1869339 RepID=UPI001824C974|nr:pyridoxamine 5'-phosphate oxidase family protein [Polaromonas sp.]NMM11041.1 pyridoxamine 5'-phosphate oxidase family protein [Polaromonas sp.]
MSTIPSDHEKLWDLIKDIRFGMFTHRHANGMLHSLPLTTQNRSMDEAATLFFFISRKSEVDSQIQQDNHVNVAYSSPSDDRYVSVSGDAFLVEDSGKKETLWSPMAKAWFPGGPTDPDLALMEVRINHAEYWDVKESKMVQLAKMAKAAFTGEPPRDLGEHKELRMS